MGSEFKVDGNIGELSVGTPRRWEPEIGVDNHNKRIHRESKIADDYKNLPFKFSKPKKSGRRILFKCNSCGHIIHSSINTVGLICSVCKKFSSVTEVD